MKSVYSHRILPNRLVGIFCLLFISSVAYVSGCSQTEEDKQSPQTQPAATQDDEDTAGYKKFLDEDADFEWLHRYPISGANDIRDILVVDYSFFAATGKGLAKYTFTDGGFKLAAEYTTADGLPSNNCIQVKADAAGGVWVWCQGGVGLLAKGADKFVGFTQENGLGVSSLTGMEISPDGKTVWVTAIEGLAAANIADLKWRQFPAKNVLDVLVSPKGDKAWYRRLMGSQCMCGTHVVSYQLDVATGTSTEIPLSGSCSHVGPKPVYFCPETSRLWLSNCYEPPLLYDPAENQTTTWPLEPRWEIRETSKKGYTTVLYDDWFGQMLPFADGSSKMWFATNAGLWQYDPSSDDWQIHRITDKPGCGNALLIRTSDAKTIYWACEKSVAKYDISDSRFTLLYESDEDIANMNRNAPLYLSPDEKYLWWPGTSEIMVGDLESNKFVSFGSKDQSGLECSGVIRFMPTARLALIATPRGVVVAQYDGRPQSVLRRSDCPIAYKVTDLLFNPDGSEVWCMMKDSHGFQQPAVVLHPESGKWEEIPDPQSGRGFNQVLFSEDGKTSWLLLDNYPDSPILERTAQNKQWRPINTKMPEYYLAEKAWLSPDEKELWVDNVGCGLLRVIRDTDEVTQYTNEDFRQIKGVAHFTLVGDYVNDLVFTYDGKYAICSAAGGDNNGITIIDRETGQSINYPTEWDVDELHLEDDGKTLCFRSGYAMSPKVFDIETRKWLDEAPEKPTSASNKEPTEELTDENSEYLARWDEYDAASNAFYELLEKDEDIHCWEDDIEHRRITYVRQTPNGSSMYIFGYKEKVGKKLVDIDLPDEYLMEAGPDGRVWFTIPGGLMSVNPDTGEVKRYE